VTLVELLDGLDADQRAAVTHEHLPLAILAPAGSGKTRVLTRRIAWRCATGVESPQHVLAITFTRAAAGELNERLTALGVREHVHVGTFHALARHELIERSGGRWNQTVVADTLPLLREVDEAVAFELRDELAWARARMVGPDTYAGLGRPTKAAPERLARAMVRYRELKARRRVVDFDDLLERAGALLEEDAAWREKRRWWFSSPYVDEFQDVNPLQIRFLRSLVGADARLCVVGDPNQSIYQFNGADPDYLRRFADHFPGGETIRLVNSYRSTPAILEGASRVLKSANQRADWLPVREPGAVPTITAVDDAGVEVAHLGRVLVDRHLPGRPWSAQAVLVRTRAQLAPITEALAALRIPHRVVGGEAVESPAMRRAIRRLRGSKLPYRQALARLAAERAELVEADDPDAGPGEDVVDVLLAAADDYERTGGRPSTDGLVAWLTLAGIAEPRDDAVALSTFHAAKGLEWDVVHLAGAEDGLVPGWWARTPAEQGEERRLFYVACTRARDELHITWARTRESGGRLRARARSPYLDDLAQALADHARLTAPVDGRREIARLRERMRR
jgi:DNA helicase-2/ATP-dependent DNA helicase PcrA